MTAEETDWDCKVLHCRLEGGRGQEPRAEAAQRREKAKHGFPISPRRSAPLAALGASDPQAVTLSLCRPEPRSSW